MRNHHIKLVLALCSLVTVVFSVTDSNDFAILKAFREGLENPGLLEWPADGDDPCGQSWKHVLCSGSRVTQIQVQNMSLKGTLPQNLNKLTKLQRLGLQRNQFTGALPSLGGLSELQYVYLDFNQFDSIPSNCFDGLVSLQFLALDSNNFNASTGWSFPEGLQDSAQLTNLSCMFCNLAGPLPVFLGSLPSLQSLKLSGNNLSGEIPVSFKGGMSLQNLWLNDQNGGGLSGTIDVVTTMDSVNVLWLHGNQFTGTIPESIGNLTVLQDLNLNGNQLVGFVPDSLAKMPLQHLDLNNNQLMGPIPKFKATEVSCTSNAFCQSTPGVPCAPEVMALLEFLGSLNYPSRLVSSWTGNNPCLWLGLACDPNSKVNSIVLPNHNLSGTLSPSVAKLDSLFQVKLASNNLGGHIPDDWTSLTSLKTLDLSANNISPPLPKFSGTVNVVISGNPLFNGGSPANPVPSPGNNPSSGSSDSPPSNPSSPNKGIGSSPMNSSVSTKPKMSTFVAIIALVASIAFIAILVIPLSIYCCKKRKDTFQAPSSLVIHPRDPSDSDNTVKVVVSHDTNGCASTITGNGSASRNSSGIGESHVIEAGNLVISVQVLRNVTKNFASENELGRGGFGVVYKGELDDGTKIAVKRMEAGVISSKGLDEFQAEIAVLSKVRHRHLVSLLVTGKITTKADVFSFGVVLMELLTGLMALDDDRPEESQYLAAWFWQIKSEKQKLRAAIDPALDVKDEKFESISIVAELAGHCTAREPNQRPDMGHAVNVLVPLVEKWNPFNDDTEEYCGIDYSLPLNQMVKGWQEAEGKDLSYVDLKDSKSSIPARPAGFAESFTSADGR
uniref:Putative receptor protein kinase TMK1 n=1 Tax=Populus alba TaxID=43335 RepID=A0A4U5NKK9_POPAL|nr:putative receptor protein kinase TMK1 [Populus alba]